MKIGYTFQKIKEDLSAVVFFLLPTTITLLCRILSIYLIFYGNLFWKSFMIIYILYIRISTSKFIFTIKGNGQRSLRSNWFWRNLRRYFPIELVKTENLPANRNYIFATFPHGILPYGSAINAAYDIDNWLHLFPGIRPKHALLNVIYTTPFLYDYWRFSGFISVSEKSLMYHLTSRYRVDGFSSNGVVILVGGAQEVLDSYPGQYKITLLKRKGFVRVAIKSGAAIVPCFTFGEVDNFDRWDGKWKWQMWLKRVTGIPFVLIKGRCGLIIPYKRRIVQVVGAPIEVQQCDNPRTEYVDEIHGKVVEGVRNLFETHKRKYIEDYENVKLIIK